MLSFPAHLTEIERDLRDRRPHRSIAGAHRLHSPEAPSRATWRSSKSCAEISPGTRRCRSQACEYSGLLFPDCVRRIRKSSVGSFRPDQRIPAESGASSAKFRVESVPHLQAEPIPAPTSGATRRLSLPTRSRPHIALKKGAATATDTQRTGRVLPMPLLDGLHYQGVRVWIFDRDNDDDE